MSDDDREPDDGPGPLLIFGVAMLVALIALGVTVLVQMQDSTCVGVSW